MHVKKINLLPLYRNHEDDGAAPPSSIIMTKHDKNSGGRGKNAIAGQLGSVSVVSNHQNNKGNSPLVSICTEMMVLASSINKSHIARS